MAGGHTVPIDKIVHRYVRSMGNLPATVRVADRVYVLQRGAIVHAGPANTDVLGEDLLRHYLGGGAPTPV